MMAVTSASSLVGIINDDNSSRIIDSGIFATTSCTFSFDGKKLYVSSSLLESPGQKKISAIDTNTWSVVQTWATDEKNIQVLQALPNGKVYALGQYLPLITGSLKVITDNTIKSIDLGMMPISIASNGHLARIYGWITVNGKITAKAVVVDTESDQVVDSAATGSDYMSFPSDNDQWFFYHCSMWGDISGINLAQKQLVPGLYRQAEQQPLTLGMIARRQEDGSDVIVLLREGRLDVFTAVQPPTLYSAVSGALFKVGPVAPGEIVSLFGAKLGTETATFSTVPLPTQLAGMSVVMNSGVSIPLYYVSPTQINAQIPFEVTGDKVTLQVVTPQGNTNSVTVPLAKSAPAPFAGPNGEVLVDLTGRWTKASAVAGQVAMMFATGLGQVSPAVPAGSPAPSSPLSTVVGATTVTMCGQSAQVLFSGLAPSYIGLYQINMVVPQECGTGQTENAQITIN